MFFTLLAEETVENSATAIPFKLYGVSAEELLKNVTNIS